MSETWLTPEEVFELTGVKRWKAQCRRLATMQLPFLPNAVGRPLVERAAVLSMHRVPVSKPGPNWEAMVKSRPNLDAKRIRPYKPRKKKAPQ